MLLLALLPAGAVTGCATTPQSTLTVKSVQSQQTFKPQFDSAYASRSPEGDYDVVLAGDSGPAEAGGGEAVRQVMHVRVVYRPMRHPAGPPVGHQRLDPLVRHR